MPHSKKQFSLCITSAGGDRGRFFRACIAPRGVAKGLLSSPVLSLTETKVKAGEMGKPLENGFERDEFLRGQERIIHGVGEATCHRTSLFPQIASD